MNELVTALRKAIELNRPNHPNWFEIADRLAMEQGTSIEYQIFEAIKVLVKASPIQITGTHPSFVKPHPLPAALVHEILKFAGSQKTSNPS